jgi:hypothetical protein
VPVIISRGVAQGLFRAYAADDAPRADDITKNVNGNGGVAHDFSTPVQNK